MTNYDTVCSVDPGLTGGISFLKKDEEPIVFRMPVKKIIKNKKKKNVYDLKEIVKIIKNNKKGRTIFIVEKQGVRPGEGAVSAMTIGEGYGSLKGIAVALNLQVIVVLPHIWKKHFAELSTPEMDQFRDKGKAIKAEMKEFQEILKTLSDSLKNTKDASQKKLYKKEIEDNKNIASSLKKQHEKNNRSLKSAAKKQSRELCKQMYPDMEEEFKLVKDDGKSDALLIGLYARDNINELVSKNKQAI